MKKLFLGAMAFLVAVTLVAVFSLIFKVVITEHPKLS